jgi:hypothetical protein
VAVLDSEETGQPVPSDLSDLRLLDAEHLVWWRAGHPVHAEFEHAFLQIHAPPFQCSPMASGLTGLQLSR